jgi:hypothetical protein
MRAAIIGLIAFACGVGVAGATVTELGDTEADWTADVRSADTVAAPAEDVARPKPAALRLPPPQWLARALPYERIGDKKIDRNGRKATVVYIYAPATDQHERAHTALRAAIDAVRDGGLDAAIAMLLLSPNKALTGRRMGRVAIAIYSPDGKGLGPGTRAPAQGFFEVLATDRRFTRLEIRKTELWYEKLEELGRLDALQSYIGKALNVPPDSIKRPFISIKGYHPPAD